MITVGLIKELYFISRVLNEHVRLNFQSTGMSDLSIQVSGVTLDVWYKDRHIWREAIDGETSFFGIESCDAIARIIVCIDNNDIDNARRLIKIDDID